MQELIEVCEQPLFEQLSVVQALLSLHWVEDVQQPLISI
jgi:hypothetical protein